MKVEEAKTKVCPFIQHLNIFPSVKAIKIREDGASNIKCICGDCMAWEYTKYRVEREDLSEEEWNGALAPDRLYGPLPEDEKEGYCKRLGQ